MSHPGCTECTERIGTATNELYHAPGYIAHAEQIWITTDEPGCAPLSTKYIKEMASATIPDNYTALLNASY